MANQPVQKKNWGEGGQCAGGIHFIVAICCVILS